VPSTFMHRSWNETERKLVMS
jgi:hypothetical protein